MGQAWISQGAVCVLATPPALPRQHHRARGASAPTLTASAYCCWCRLARSICLTMLCCFSQRTLFCEAMVEGSAQGMDTQARLVNPVTVPIHLPISAH